MVKENLPFRAQFSYTRWFAHIFFREYLKFCGFYPAAGTRNQRITNTVDMATALRCDEWPKIEDASELEAKVLTMPLWRLRFDDGVPKLIRQFAAKNFVAALDFVAKAGEVAEQRGHHPDLHITGYRNVTVEIYTHSLGGLTQNDFDLAAALDLVPVGYFSKWLKENPHAKGEEK